MKRLFKVMVDSKAREIRMARNGNQKFIVGKWRRLQTNAVLSAPGVPPPRQMVFKVPFFFLFFIFFPSLFFQVAVSFSF